ncbi:MAG: hypothetical protein ACREP4_12930 [Stenotrophomonas sp.]|uniref:hypothetical protein n=1 Tax=Stenotrophomonas sp. TaxID=69392 RepID=UPI003D6C844A
MQFRVTSSNLTIALDESEAQNVVSAVTRYLVPRFAKKIYFLSDQLAVWHQEIEGLSRVIEDQEPSNFLSSFRIVQRGSDLYVVAATRSKFSPENWRSLTKELMASAA